MIAIFISDRVELRAKKALKASGVIACEKR